MGVDLQTAVATGSGIWAAHFIAMLAFKSAIPATYEPLLTLTSLLIAISVSGAGFCIAEGNRPKWVYPLAGAVVGLGIATMHYAGMQAMSVSGHIRWDEVLVVASIAAGNQSDRGCDVVLQSSELETRCRRSIHGSGLHNAFHGHGSGNGGI